jgi:hypothetical protein
MTPEQIAEMNRTLDAVWLGPSFRTLLDDARHFHELMGTPGTDQGRHARATVVFSVGAIEAATNDALAAIADLFTDGYWGSECRYEKPWVHFWNRSRRRLFQVQESRSRIERKRKYVLQLLERETGWTLDDDCRAQIHSIVNIRNRIVHMASLSSPKNMLSILNVRQIRHTAGVAVEAAAEYTEFLDEGFNEMNLPIRVQNPDLSDWMPE